MTQLSQHYILQQKTKVSFTEGFCTLLFIDGKFQQFIDRPTNCLANNKIVLISTNTHNVLWGTREKLCFEINGNSFHVGLSGQAVVEINNPRKFYNEILIKDKEIDLQRLQKIIVPEIINCLDSFIHRYIKENNLNISQIETYKSDLARNARIEISKRLEFLFGINCKVFTILNVLLDSEEMEKLKKQHLEQKTTESEVLFKLNENVQKSNFNKQQENLSKTEEEMLLE